MWIPYSDSENCLGALSFYQILWAQWACTKRYPEKVRSLVPVQLDWPHMHLTFGLCRLL